MDHVVKKINYFSIIFLVLLVPLFFINEVFGYYVDINFHDVLWGLIPIFLFVYIYNIIKKKIKIGIVDCLVYILIILNIIVCIYAIDRDVSIFGNNERHEGFLSLLAYYSIFLSARCIDNKKQIKWIFNIFMIIGIAQFLYCIIQIYFEDWLLPALVFRVSSNMADGFIGNPNFMGSYIILIFGFVVIKYLTNDNNYIWYFILSIIFFINILFTQSTGPFLGTVFMIFFTLVFLIIKRKLKIFRYILLVCVLTLSYFMIDYSLKVVPSANHYIVNAYTINYDLKQLYRAITGDMDKYDIPDEMLFYDYSTLPITYDDNINELGSGRIMIWKNSLKLLPNYYLFGCGLDNFGLAYKWHYNNVYYDKAHNDYLNVLITRGMFSLITYLILLFIIFIKGIKSNNNLVWALLLSIVGYAAQSVTNISVINVAPYFYMMCGFVIAVVNMEKVE